MSDSRLEKFIYAICSMDVSDLPVPLSRIEKLWNCLITGETPDFEPLSRNEKYLMAMLDRYDISNLPAPMSRGEKLLYKIAVGETDLSDVPGYLSRYEELLKYLIENGGISGGDFEYVLHTINQSMYTLYTTAEKPVKSAILKGNTLVNIFNNWVNNVGTLTPVQTQDGYFLFTGNNKYARVNLYDIPTFERGVEYTFIYRIKNSTYDGKNDNILRLDVGATAHVYVHDVTNGIWKIKKSFSTDETNCFVKVLSWVGSTGSVEVSLQIIEGDYTNVDIPYFEGMQSAKMPVLTTTGKNLFNGGIVQGTVSTDNGVTITTDSAIRSDDYIELIGGETYTISKTKGTKTIAIVIYDENKKFVRPVWDKTFTLNTNEKYIKFADSENDLTNLYQIEKGVNSSSYEPYKSNILSCLEPVELGSVGEVKDELNLLTQQLTQRTETRPYQEGDELNSEFVTDITNTRYKLAQEVVKTVDLTTVDQDNQPTQLGTFENITHVSLESAGLIPEVEMEVATNLLEDTVFNLTNAFNTLYPTAAKPVVDGMLTGQTLVNLATQKSGRFNGTRFLRIPLSYTLKSNTNYFVNFIVKESTLTDGVTCRFKNTSTGTTIGAIKSSGIIATNANVADILEIYIDNTDDVTSGLDAIIDDIMVIEYQDGMENWDISYFEGMQSVQAPGVTMTGKNLINRQTMNGGYIDANGEFQTNSTDLASDFIRISPNTNYTYKVFTNKTYDMRFTFFDKNKSMIERTDSFRISNGRHKTYSSPSNAYYVRVHSNEFSNIGFDAGISLVMGDTPLSSYEPFKSITLSTPSDLELRKVGEVQDEVNVMTGEVVERIGEVVLDGVNQSYDSYGIHSANSNLRYIVGQVSNPCKFTGNYNRNTCVSDKISTDYGYGHLTDSDWGEGIALNGRHFKLVINLDRLSEDNLGGVKTYLSQNPITIQYELATPTTKTVPLTIINQDGNETKLRTFDETTHVLLESEGIPMSKASLTVRTKIPSASSTSLLMDDISTEQRQLETTVDEQSNNVDATMIATTEIYEETL